jgi:Methyltransferase domain
MDRRGGGARCGPHDPGASLSLRAVFDRGRPDFPAGTPAWRDASFSALLALCPALEGMRAYLPAALGTPAFAGQDAIEALDSSYKDHGYGNLLYALARVLKPRHCIELGVFQGYSLLAVAAALRDNGRGTIDGFDLFEDYPYRHVAQADAAGNIRARGLHERARAHRADAFSVHERHATVDWLHVDISNSGDTYRRVFAQWEPKVAQVMVFEGGGAERDQVDWMLAYRKPAIAPAVEALRRSHSGWKFAVLSPFPSITLALRSSACAAGA